MTYTSNTYIHQIRLHGYGGSSHVEVVSGRGTSGDCRINLGEIASGNTVKTEISVVYKSGLRRTAFVLASCCPGKVNVLYATHEHWPLCLFAIHR